MDKIVFPILIIIFIILISFEMRLSSIKRTLMSIGADTMRIMTALIKKRILHVSDIEDVSIKESEKIVDQRILIRIDKEEREENDREEQDL